MTQFQQILFEDVEQANFVEAENIGGPGADEVYGRTLFSLLSTGTELNIYRGFYQAQGLSWGRLPFVPGYAVVFVVEKVDAQVDDVVVGDHVYWMGKHTSHQRVSREKVLPLPEGLIPELGTFARIANIGMSCLTTAEARPPAKVATMGLGMVGLAAAMVFKVAGYRVIAVDPLGEHHELTQQIGIENVMSEIDVDVIGRVPMILDFSGHKGAINSALDIVMSGGEIVVAGVPMVPKTDILAQEVLNKLFRSFARLRSGKEQQTACA